MSVYVELSAMSVDVDEFSKVASSDDDDGASSSPLPSLTASLLNTTIFLSLFRLLLANIFDT